MHIRTTHIDFSRVQSKDFPFNSEILNLKVDGKAVKITYIENPIQSGSATFEFRMYNVQDEIDFDRTAYTYLGLLEYEQVDYHVFAKMIGQLID
ncbi:hypothetical protein [Bacillus wiedmannii]|uniref:hypothetical protein n=1 Tax=Bacillus wiedmannii TaxID=1890302 RepID=UPI000B44ADA5|nr:hypothetical protein [Bacillus wiedmannii]OUB89737.1 hypothetical protein BK788_02610 [Bacillus thuringiensis serovar sinensis]